MSASTDWFRDCGWGVFTHYLTDKETTAQQWNRQIAEFDVRGLADQLESVRARYYFITLGQNSGHFCAPNATYDALVGAEPSKCSERDLIGDLHQVLSPKGIKLLVYLPSGAPAHDEQAMRSLEWEWGYCGTWPQAHSGARTGKRLVAFQRKWEAIIRDWSQRWGDKVAGWWIDGCYFADEMHRHEDEPNFGSLAAALKSGNADAMVAFNPGVVTPVVCHSEAEDYTAGEISSALPECPGRWVEREGHRAQYHVLTYLGETWGSGQPRFSADLAAAYTRHVVSKQGVISWDVPIGKEGLIPEAHVEQLAPLGDIGDRQEGGT